jgi:Uma2 family endonuclease
LPTAVTETLNPLDAPRKRWTREEIKALESMGAWDQQRPALVEGELINKMRRNRPHSIVLIYVRGWLITVLGNEFASQEASLDMAPADNPINEPEPALAVLVKPPWEYPESNPQPAGLRLVAEGSDTTVGFDLTTNAGLYGRAEIPEYWAFDIPARRLIVHRDPHNGVYRSIAAYKPNENIRPLAAPDHEFQVRTAFPE